MKIQGDGALDVARKALVGLLATLAVVSTLTGAVANSSCHNHSFLDYWLLGLGLSTLGALMGVWAWRGAPSTTNVINGPKHLMVLLVFINVAWLFIGNVAVAIIVSSCRGQRPVLATWDVSCSSSILSVSLVFVVVFDGLYTLFLVVMCARTCAGRSLLLPPAAASLHTKSGCRGKVSVVVVVVLAVTSIAVGASYYHSCHHQDWMPLWHIAFGTVAVVWVVMVTFHQGGHNYLAASWVNPVITLALPVLVLSVLLLASLTVGCEWVVEARHNVCSGHIPCNDGLATYTTGLVALLSLPLLVFFYVATVLAFLGPFLLLAASFHYCCCLGARHHHMAVCRD
ncbi:uncharacterized protein [Procambarus clarkii]|uniref:uncharacterized protein isoform X2 n=1 Tax=Procambarus clarkii TaxID=6728 RepID=UPI0037430F95